MDAALKAKWVTALRSGEYKQGSGRLKRGDEYCCLGVLCAVAPGLKAEDWQKLCSLPTVFHDRIGMADENTLIEMNDDQGKSFAEIATYIEENL